MATELVRAEERAQAAETLTQLLSADLSVEQLNDILKRLGVARSKDSTKAVLAKAAESYLQAAHLKALLLINKTLDYLIEELDAGRVPFAPSVAVDLVKILQKQTPHIEITNVLSGGPAKQGGAMRRKLLEAAEE